VDWLNNCGLVNGNIPAGNECPFLKECEMLTDNCPSVARGNIRKHSFSCACARAFALIKHNKMEG